MTYSNCPHCGSMFSTRGLPYHIEVKHPEHAVDMKHNFIIKLTKTQRAQIGKATHEYNLSFDHSIRPEEFVVAYLEAHGIIKV